MKNSIPRIIAKLELDTDITSASFRITEPTTFVSDSIPNHIQELEIRGSSCYFNNHSIPCSIKILIIDDYIYPSSFPKTLEYLIIMNKTRNDFIRYSGTIILGNFVHLKKIYRYTGGIYHIINDDIDNIRRDVTTIHENNDNYQSESFIYINDDIITVNALGKTFNCVKKIEIKSYIVGNVIDTFCNMLKKIYKYDTSCFMNISQGRIRTTVSKFNRDVKPDGINKTHILFTLKDSECIHSPSYIVDIRFNIKRMISFLNNYSDKPFMIYFKTCSNNMFLRYNDKNISDVKIQIGIDTLLQYSNIETSNKYITIDDDIHKDLIVKTNNSSNVKISKINSILILETDVMNTMIEIKSCMNNFSVNIPNVNEHNNAVKDMLKYNKRIYLEKYYLVYRSNDDNVDELITRVRLDNNIKEKSEITIKKKQYITLKPTQIF